MNEIGMRLDEYEESAQAVEYLVALHVDHENGAHKNDIKNERQRNI